MTTPTARSRLLQRRATLPASFGTLTSSSSSSPPSDNKLLGFTFKLPSKQASINEEQEQHQQQEEEVASEFIAVTSSSSVSTPTIQNNTTTTTTTTTTPHRFSSPLRALLAEFLGTFMLVLIGCGANISLVMVNETRSALQTPSTLLAAAVVWGLLIACLVHMFHAVSGAHFNPSISLAFLITKRMNMVTFVCYAVCQFAGAIAASAVHLSIYSSEVQHHSLLGMTRLEVTPARGVLFETVLTATLTFVIWGVALEKNDHTHVAFELKRSSAPWYIGAVMSCLIVIGGPVTGASMNAARSLGPAVMMSRLSHMYVYLVGPTIGACIGSVSYEYLFFRRVVAF